MELTLKRLLEHAEFKKYRGKGYDPTEVDDFLDKAAAMAGKVEVQLTQALEAAKAGGGAGPDPAAIEAEVERRVAARMAELPPARPTEEDEAAQSSRVLLMAQKTADDTVRSAQEDAQRIVAEAEERASTTVAEADARAQALRAEAEELSATTRETVEAEAAAERREARQKLAAEIAELEGVREALRSDVNVLERHVEEQRSQLGSTLAELQQILDDPSGFRMAPPPALNDPELPDFSDVTGAPAEAPTPVEVAPEPLPEPAPEPEVAAEPQSVDAAEVFGGPDPSPAALDDAASPESPNGFDQAPTPQALSFGEVDHAAPGIDDPLDPGPPTAPVSAVDLGVVEPAEEEEEDDPFLAELRKAMVDDEPLGPRDHDAGPGPDTLFEDDDRRGWRFGRRR